MMEIQRFKSSQTGSILPMIKSVSFLPKFIITSIDYKQRLLNG